MAVIGPRFVALKWLVWILVSSADWNQSGASRQEILIGNLELCAMLSFLSSYLACHWSRWVVTSTQRMNIGMLLHQRGASRRYTYTSIAFVVFIVDIGDNTRLSVPYLFRLGIWSMLPLLRTAFNGRHSQAQPAISPPFFSGTTRYHHRPSQHEARRGANAISGSHGSVQRVRAPPRSTLFTVTACIIAYSMLIEPG